MKLVHLDEHRQIWDDSNVEPGGMVSPLYLGLALGLLTLLCVARACTDYQIEECLAATTPRDCPEKQAGTFCTPKRAGIFRIRDKSIVLHVGSDVQNEMSCMIQADGVLMGCSTFGQIAGLLARGISLFSTRCSGEATPHQYRSIPPLAIAEKGHLWVPIEGSWHDPVLTSRSIFSAALDTLLVAKSRR